MSAPVSPTLTTPEEQRFSHWPAWPSPYPLRLTTSPEHECPYLPGRIAVTRAFLARRLPGEAHQRFMDAGFRRSGTVLYQPACPHCRACVPLRVPVESFRPSKSQRRCFRKNQDLTIAFDTPVPTEEKHRLYQLYLDARHNKMQNRDWDDFVEFLYSSPTSTLEFCYRTQNGRLIGVGLCDALPQALSTVYFYFDPAEHRRGLGTFSSLVEIEWCREHARNHYYLGFWVSDCPKMAYKSRFGPHEHLRTDGVWRKMM